MKKMLLSNPLLKNALFDTCFKANCTLKTDYRLLSKIQDGHKDGRHEGHQNQIVHC